MVNQALRDWVNKAKQRGYKDRQLYAMLSKYGYKHSDINEALKPTPIAPPPKKKSSHKVLWTILIIIGVLIVLSIVGVLLLGYFVTNAAVSMSENIFNSFNETASNTFDEMSKINVDEERDVSSAYLETDSKFINLYNGKDYFSIGEIISLCPGQNSDFCSTFKYSFDVYNEEQNDDIDSLNVNVTVKEGKVIQAVYSEITNMPARSNGFCLNTLKGTIVDTTSGTDCGQGLSYLGAIKNEENLICCGV